MVTFPRDGQPKPEFNGVESQAASSQDEGRIEPGVVLLGRYALEAHLASGGMGQVWRGTDLRMGGLVAVKLLTRVEPAALRRFHEEAKIAAALPGPYIARVFDFGEYGEIPFLVMELLEGETLRQRLSIESKLSDEMTLRIVGQIAEGLAAVHAAGVVHRDVKPENIFLSGVGSSVVAKLLDFGVAKSTTAQNTQAGDLVGTPNYVSPEQLADSRNVRAESDLWSLGVVAFECMTGERPFTAPSLAQVLDAIARGEPTAVEAFQALPKPVRRWFRHVLAADPTRRPSDALAFSDGLRQAFADAGGLEGNSMESGDVTFAGPRAGLSSNPALTPRRRSRGMLGWVGAAAVVLAILGWWGVGGDAGGETQAPSPISQHVVAVTAKPEQSSAEPSASLTASVSEPSVGVLAHSLATPPVVERDAAAEKVVSQRRAKRVRKVVRHAAPHLRAQSPATAPSESVTAEPRHASSIDEQDLWRRRK